MCLFLSVCFPTDTNSVEGTSVRGITLTAAHFAQLACMEKIKTEPKCAAVKVTPLTEVAIDPTLILFKWPYYIARGEFRD